MAEAQLVEQVIEDDVAKVEQAAANLFPKQPELVPVAIEDGGDEGQAIDVRTDSTESSEMSSGLPGSGTLSAPAHLNLGYVGSSDEGLSSKQSKRGFRRFAMAIVVVILLLATGVVGNWLLGNGNHNKIKQLDRSQRQQGQRIKQQYVYNTRLQHLEVKVNDLSTKLSNLKVTNTTVTGGSSTVNNSAVNSTSSSGNLGDGPFNGPNELVQLTSTGQLPVLDGSNLTNVNATTLQGHDASYFTNASNITTGTLADARLSANVALLDGINDFRPTTDNINTFQIQNSSGSITLFNVDTTGAGTLTFGAPAIFNDSVTFNSLGAPGNTPLCVNASNLLSTCTGGGGGGGVTSLDTEIGDLTIADTTASGGTITIQNASTSQKGLAQFNATNFSDNGSGVINTIQNINTGASPTFSGLTLSGLSDGVVQATSGVLSASNTLPLAVQGNITTVGALTQGSIGGSFGNINIGSNTFTGNGSGLTNLNGANLTAGSVANTALANSSLTITAGSGLQGGGTVALGGTTSLNVDFGSSAGQAVQGNTTLTCASGTGQLSGGGNAITLGSGGTCGNIAISTTPTFTSLTATGSAGITVGVAGTTQGHLVLASTGTGSVTLQTATQANALALSIPTDTNLTDTICLVNLANCSGSNGGSGNTNYIFNQTSQQASSNFNISGNGVIGGGLTVSGLGTGVVQSTSGVLSTGNVALGSQTSGSYVANLGTLTGLTTTGNSGAGSTPTLSVTYGALANTAAQGNTALSFTGAGNLQGTVSGTAGGGFTSNTLDLVSSPVISGTLAVQGAGGITVGSTTNSGTIKFLDGTGDGFTASLGLSGILGASQNFTLPSTGGTLCTTSTCVAGTSTAGGDLTGTYPNPTIAKLQGTTLTIASIASGDILQYNGTAIVNGHITNSNLTAGSFSNITGVGALTSGSIGGSFGNINIGSNVFTGDGSGITNLNGSNIATGTVANARLVNSGALTVTAGTGLSGGGSVALGSSTSLSVAYGATAGTSVQGNTTLTCPSGTGNLSGGGDVITLGNGGTCSNLAISSTPSFTSLTATGSAGITVGVAGTTAGKLVLASAGTGSVTLQSASQANAVALSIPADTNTTDTICLQTLANCSGSPTGAAGGDLTGTYPNPTIAKLQGTTLTISSIASGDVLQYNGSAIVNGHITNSNLTAGTFGNITGVGALTSGSIGGTFGNINIGSNVFTGDGSGLTNLNGSNIASGTVADGRLSANVTLQGNTFNGNSQLVQLTAGGLLPVLNGSNLTTLNGSNISSGTVANARLVNSGALTVTAGTGLSGGGSVALGSSTSLSVAYGSSAGTAVQGNTTVICPSGTGNLTGGGTSITLGTGGTCAALNTVTNPTFTGAVTLGTAATTAGQLVLNTTGSGAVTIQSASQANALQLNIPADINTTDTLCLQTLANCGSGSGVTTVGTFSGSSQTNGASISGSTITFGPADGTNPGMVSTGTQTFAGAKTFTGAATFQNLSNSTSAFKVANSSSAVLLNVDTSTGVNLITNGGFESGTTGWQASGVGASVSQVSSQAWQGTNSLQFNTGSTFVGQAFYNAYTLTAGSTYSFSFYAKVAGNTTVPGMSFGDTINGGSNVPCSSTNTVNIYWTRFTCSFTVPASPAVTSSTLYISDAFSSQTIYIDGVQLQNGSTTSAFNPGGAIQINGLINSPVQIQNAQDSQTAFRIQNASAGTTLFRADTGLLQLNVTGAQAITGGLSTSNFSTISAPTVTAVNPGSPTGGYAYEVAAVNANGGVGLPSAASSTIVNSQTLSNTTLNRITWTALTGASSYNIYRTLATASVNASTLGLIGNVSGQATLSFDDTGIAATGSTPTTDNSGSASFAELNVVGNATFNNGYNVTAGTLSINNTSNAINEIQVQNASSLNVLQLDTLGSNLIVGSVYSSLPNINSGTLSSVGAFTTNASTNINGSGSTCATATELGATATVVTVSGNTYLYNIGGQSSATGNAVASACMMTLNNSTGAPTGSAWTANNQALITGGATNGVINATAVSYNNYIYLLGGNTNALSSVVDTAQVESASVASNGTLTWTASVSTLPVALEQATSVVSNGYLYVIGGSTNGTVQSKVYYAQILSGGALGSWQTATNLPYVDAGAASFVYDGYLYVVGGGNASTCFNTSETIYNKMLSAPINANGSIGNWTTTTGIGFSVQYASAVVYQGNVFIANGTSGSNPCSPISPDIQTASINANGTVGSWTTATGSSTSRFLSATAGYNGYIYLMGGTTTMNSATPNYSGVFTYGQVTTTSNPSTGSGGQNVNLSVNGAATIQTGTNSPTALSVVTNQGQSVLNVDTKNIAVTIGGQLFANGGLVVNGLSAPSSLNSIVNGTTGSTSYVYAVSAVNANGNYGAAASAPMINNGNATLASPNPSNTITWSGVPGAAMYYVYRTTSGGTPSSTGYIGTIYADSSNNYSYSFTDTGIAATNTNGAVAGAAPSTDISGQITANSTALFKNSVNSASSFMVQNANATTTVLNIDTTNGTLVTASNLTVSGTTTLTGAATASNNLTVQGTTQLNGVANVANTLTVTSAGSLVYNGTTGALFQDNSDSTTAFQIQNHAGNSNLLVADTTNSLIGIGVTPNINQGTLQVSGSINIRGVGAAFMINGTTICSDTAGTGSTPGCSNNSGSASYVQNQVGVDQTANFRIINAVGTASSIRAAASGTADLLDFQNSSGTIVSKFDSSGNLGGKNGSGSNSAGSDLIIGGGQGTGNTNGGNILLGIAKAGTSGSSLNSLTTVATFSGVNGSALFKNAADSSTAFQIQSTGSVGLFVADTSGLKITISGTTSTQGTLVLQDAVLKSSQTNALTTGSNLTFAGACGTPTGTSFGSGSTNEAGSVAFTPSASSVSCTVTITFANPQFVSTPKSVILTPNTSRTAIAGPYVSAISTSSFTVSFGATPNTNANGFYWWIIE